MLDSEIYPHPRSWYARLMYADNHVYRLNDELANDPQPWEVQKTLTHVYGCYFSDMVALCRRVGPDSIDWGYKPHDPNDVEDEYFGFNVPSYYGHAHRLTDASSELVTRFGFENPHYVFFMEADFIFFRQHAITKPEEIEIKLALGLSLIDLSDTVSLVGLYNEL